MSFVLDNSVAMLWLLPQSNPAGLAIAQKVLDRLQDAGAQVPSLWHLEAANVMAKCLRQEKITQAQTSTFVTLLEALDISTDTETSLRALHDTLDLARRYSLSAYDAAYLELALRKSLPLATLDAQLNAAARQAGVPVLC
jgi:predicted nucleic acid-binding protein